MAVLDCLSSSGAIIYSPEGNYGTDGSGGSYGGSLSGGSGSVGGMGGGGRVWSDSEQVIWISVNNAPKYPVRVAPGWNEVHFWIPFIFPDEEWVEAPIIVEAPGYLLIPAGFEMNIKTGKNAPKKTGNPKMTDRLKFVDVYDLDIRQVPVPIDLDSLLDKIVFEDTHSIDVIKVGLLAEKSLIEDLEIKDTHFIEVEQAPIPVDLDGLLDEVTFDDEHSIDVINTRLIDEQFLIDDLSLKDTHYIEVEQAPITVDLDGILEELTLDDEHSIDVVNATILEEKGLLEEINIEDVHDIDVKLGPFKGEFDNVEELGITDIISKEVIETTTNNESTTEGVGFNDFIYIEK